ncbi:sulfurtransferase complex subunit TusB [Vibrio gallaecicus]|uniref:Sulfurtransferase complex subunit TusB n=1 Tax=Vibrio gallaecicus TaxID=552386 RepID=A0ABV4N6S3_9VIBR
MLHIVKSLSKLPLVFQLFSEGDQLILTEDSVYASLPNHEYHTQLHDLNKVSVLEADLQSRGLQNLVSETFEQVDFEGFVDLTILHLKSITW